MVNFILTHNTYTRNGSLSTDGLNNSLTFMLEVVSPSFNEVACTICTSNLKNTLRVLLSYISIYTFKKSKQNETENDVCYNTCF